MTLRRIDQATPRAALPPAAIEQYRCVAFPRPFKLGAGSKLFFVGHGTPKV
jgi:hypothetical protein